MIDFMMVATRSTKRGVIEIYPKFIIRQPSSDLMIRGGDFYAVWLEEKGLWSTNEQDALDLIDKELDNYAKKNKDKFDSNIKILHMWDAETGMVDKWHKYCQKHLRDSFHMLDEKLIFSNTNTDKKDYASKKLNYPLENGSINAYEKLISTLYTPEERHKIEWAIGAVISGDSKKIQKFLVLYGSSGTGKSTILNIIQQLFDGYYSTFDAKALGSSNNSFALEAFKTNPLVAIQHDGDLSRIEDNTRLNSLVSHELMTVNEKFKSAYTNRFKSFLFMGTNKPVRITDAKSGLIRRLIDVSPSGNILPTAEYNNLIKQIPFELGGIATHCLDVYEESPDIYNNYIPVRMMSASNDFYNYIVDNYFIFKEDDSITLKSAWELYKTYCSEAKVLYPLPRKNFQEELKNYFKNFEERGISDDGTRVRSLYSGFKTDIFDSKENSPVKPLHSLTFNCKKSVFDKEYSECIAQYANDKGTPKEKWKDVTTKLADINTNELHYVRVPKNHIVIDFDIKDKNGNKSLEKNIAAASMFTPTYAELSKSGSGIHLHYIYLGDVSRLKKTFLDNPDIEIKVFSGNSALRRKLTKCNNLPIAAINSGLPLEEEKNMVNIKQIRSEQGLRRQIIKNLNKEFLPATKPSIDFIFKILEDAHNTDLIYDISDMAGDIMTFAMNSTNNSEYCIKKVLKNEYLYKSKEKETVQPLDNDDSNIIFFDCEVFPNLFLVNWKVRGENNQIVRLINPTSEQIEELIKNKIVGFNCRRYDNHILYARLLGYTNEQLYDLSQQIINKQTGFFGEAYNLSYTDIYDFCSTKQSLKKWEIELDIHHQELGFKWDEPVPEKKWNIVSEYCDNDILASEAVFEHCKGDFLARKILASLAGGTVNDTTNSLSAKIIFGNNKNPQESFNYRDLSKPVSAEYYNEYRKKFGDDYTFYIFDSDGNPTYKEYKDNMKLKNGYSILPFFPGYSYKNGESIYKNEIVGEGGYVYSNPGMYGDVALLDVESMHPSTIEIEVLFGKDFTNIFGEIKRARLSIKHNDIETAMHVLNGKLKPFLTDDYNSNGLEHALKIVINAIYGLTAAHFSNPFKDIRNKDNIVAKRGALFMINLKEEVEKRGFVVAHIKTDSIKIPDATPEIIDFVKSYGKQYGYSFEHEATYDRMCLVNNAVYIAKYDEFGKRDKGGKCANEWTATGAQFAVPYVFKTLFTHEPIIFNDLCETKSVTGTSSLYLDMNEKFSDVTEYEKEYENRKSSNPRLNSPLKDISDDELKKIIAKGHAYRFVGRVGRFCPIKQNCGGGILYREKDGKYYAVTGTKGYRWLESESVKLLNKEDCIDEDYYRILVTEAAQTIIAFGDINWFCSNEPYIPPKFKNGKPVYTNEKIFKS